MSSSQAIFLSYAREDSAIARRTAEALRTAGIEVWFDEDELRGGDAWDAKIRQQIKECALFVPIISAHTQARIEGYFRLEWKLAVDRSHLMADDAPFIVPIVIDDTRESAARVPEKFLARQWTRVGESPDTFVQRIRNLLGAEPIESLPTRLAKPATGDTGAIRRRSSRPALRPMLFALVIAVVVAAGAFWHHQRGAGQRWAHGVALPEIARLAQRGDFAAAFDLATRAEKIIPLDPTLADYWPRFSIKVTLPATPNGIEVYVKPYRQPAADWQRLGITPLPPFRLPHGLYRWQLRKDGQVLAERAALAASEVGLALPPAGTVPTGMVHVTGKSRLHLIGLEHLREVDTPEFYIDKFEVTNRQFQDFVAAGGYTNASYWKEPFRDQGRELTRAEAMARFVDQTGRTGPATWKDGRFAEGDADRPVTGVSWYEAAAYAEFARKRLPSIYHWSRAASGNFVDHIAPLSNFSNRELAPVGTFPGMSAWGAFDMAGNAKEWCSTAADTHTRYLLGAGWRDPVYQFTAADAQSGFDRGPANGFRCMALAPGTVLSPEIEAPVERAFRDYSLEKPVSDDVFRAYLGFYAYDKKPLESRVELEDDSDRRWHKSKVTFITAYSNERMAAYLFRPRTFSPPFQTIVYFPGSNALNTNSSANIERLDLITYLVASGRTVVYPIYKGTYERRDPSRGNTGVASSVPDATNAYRDRVIHWSNDFGRTLDYLETRSDVQMDKLAYYGASWGARLGTILLAVEPRIKVAVLSAGGFRPLRPQPQVDDFNFAPRVRIPTLMLNGRYDFTFPIDIAQLPLYHTLGTPSEHKKHELFDYSHVVPAHITGKAAVDWLDRYLGPVK